jgi:predicted house-cleaning noncanonical NTP pyrophosphatase (MazG superfamily)
MRTTYNKLVRDLVPDVIWRHGKRCAVETMAEAEFRQAVRDKVIEEAHEVAQASGVQLVSELADVFEVVDARLSAHGIPYQQVKAEQERRRAERGAFQQRIRLLWTESSHA